MRAVCPRCAEDPCLCSTVQDDRLELVGEESPNLSSGKKRAAPAVPARGPQSKHWVFTVNNYTCILLDLPTPASYVVFQEEIGEQGTAHIQGYVQFVSKVRGSTVTKLISESFGHGARTAAANGSDEQNRTYCTKEEGRLGGPYEYGARQAIAGGKGGRSDLMMVKRDLDAGKSMKMISNDHFGAFIRYARGLKEYKRINTQPRSSPPEIIVYIGPSGTGKSRAALDENPGAYWFPAGGKWWDDYDGESCCVIDEMYGHRFAFSFLLQLLDRYPMKVETKGGFVEFTSTRIVMTSNQEPEDWYDGERTHQMVWAENPLNRRLRDYARIVRTGVVHRRVRQRVIPVEDEAFGQPQ